MPLPDIAERRIAGHKRVVEFAVESDESMADAWQWWQYQTEKTRRSFEVLMKRLSNEGKINNKEQFRLLDEPIWEFKRGGHRLLCYRDGVRWLLTNNLEKSGRKDISADIKTAIRIGERHLEWEASQKQRALEN